MLIVILTPVQPFGLSIVSPWAFSHHVPRLDNSKSRTNIPPISSPGNWTQCFLWWSPIQVLTLLSDNSTHWAAVMLCHKWYGYLFLCLDIFMRWGYLNWVMKIIKFMINVDTEAKNFNSVINRFEKFGVIWQLSAPGNFIVGFMKFNPTVC